MAIPITFYMLLCRRLADWPADFDFRNSKFSSLTIHLFPIDLRFLPTEKAAFYYSSPSDWPQSKIILMHLLI